MVKPNEPSLFSKSHACHPDIVTPTYIRWARNFFYFITLTDWKNSFCLYSEGLSLLLCYNSREMCSLGVCVYVCARVCTHMCACVCAHMCVCACMRAHPRGYGWCCFSPLSYLDSSALPRSLMLTSAMGCQVSSFFTLMLLFIMVIIILWRNEGWKLGMCQLLSDGVLWWLSFSCQWWLSCSPGQGRRWYPMPWSWNVSTDFLRHYTLHWRWSNSG